MASLESHLEATRLFTIATGGLFPTSLNATAADSRAAFLYDSTDDDVVVINANDGSDDDTFESNIDDLVSGDGFYAFTSTIDTPIGGGGGNRSLQDVLATVITAATATTSTTTTTTSFRPQQPIWLIVCYSVILLCAIIGNLLVISTLVQNRRMRTITNFFLLNLAISDILLGVLCMPITLVGTLLRNFIFGEVMCKLIAFSQAASVAVSSWTLVAISCERYYAICHPLRSRTWQTINHAYKIIGFIWMGSIVCMLPIAVFSKLIPTSRLGLRKCREVWPDDLLVYEQTYNIFLDLALLVLPLMILCIAYILITRTLYIGMKQERAMIFGNSSRDSYKFNGCLTEVATLTMGGAGGKSATTTTTATTTANGGLTTLSMDGSGSGSNSQFSLNTSFRLRDMRPAGRSSFGKSDSGYGSVSGASSASACANMKINPDVEIVCSQQQSGMAASGGHRKQYYDEYVYSSSSNSYKRKMLSSSSTDGRRHLYCMRSASIKSLNRPGHPAATSTTSTTTMTHTPSMTVINMPQQQRFKLNLQRHQNALQLQQQQLQFDSSMDRRKSRGNSMRITEAALRRSNMTKNLESKKRVVKMLFVLVLEFFVCWTPLYVFNTLTLFVGPVIYEYIDYKAISFFQLLAYSSSCCNPITYCFMNAGFRRAFLDTFRSVQWQNFWRKRYKSETNLCVAGNSLNMANSVTQMTNNTVLDSPRL